MEVSEIEGGGEGDGREGWQCFPDPGGTAPPLPFDHILEIVLENVLWFLTSRRDRNAASLVCKSWYRVEAETRIELFIGNCYAVSPSRAIDRFHRVRSLILKGRPRITDFNLLPSTWGALFTPWITAIAPAYPFLEKICLKRVTVDDDDLYLLACSFPCFRDLSLIKCSGFSTAGLANITANCMYLRSLDLIGNDVEYEDGEEAVDWVSAFPPGNTYLESLVFDCVSCPVNFEALASLVARSPFLWRLRVSEDISAGQLCQLMANKPQITDLGTGSFEAWGVDGDADTILQSAFHACKSLTFLSGFTNVFYLHTILPVCANLTSLSISNAYDAPLQLSPAITCCHNLETLWVREIVGDEGLQMVAASCMKLKKLTVFRLNKAQNSEICVSDVGLVAISIGCPNLRSILYFCQRMTNSAVVTMSNNCQELEVFRLCIMGGHGRRPDHLTGEPMDEGFGAIVKNCKNLTRLAVTGLVTDMAFADIGNYGKLLKTLSVSFAESTDLGLRHVLQGCSRLKKLEIRGCHFGDAALLSGINHYYNLRFVWMSSCSLSMNCCEEVARALPRMVVEVAWNDWPAPCHEVQTLYMYRSVVGPRNDAPPYMNILSRQGAG